MKKIPIISIDLSLSPRKRWLHLPKYLRRAGRALARRAAGELGDPWLEKLAGWILDACTVARNPYRKDIVALADLMDIPKRTALTANFSYEINQISLLGAELCERSPDMAELRKRIASTPATALRSLRNAVRACTAGAASYPKLGMTHVRNMDWHLEGLGRHTVLFRYCGAPAGEFLSVGWPGYAGVLSGMAPGRFSATVNQAFPLSMPSLQWPPSHLLRWVFENCESYQDALEALSASSVCFPAFVLLVGTKLGQATVIEQTTRGNRVHRMSRRRPIAIANDYLSGDWRSELDLSPGTVKPHEKSDYCEHRRNRMLTELKRRRPATIERAILATEADWINNKATMQRMVFVPATGQALVIGLEDQEPVVIGKAGLES